MICWLGPIKNYINDEGCGATTNLIGIRMVSDKNKTGCCNREIQPVSFELQQMFYIIFNSGEIDFFWGFAQFW